MKNLLAIPIEISQFHKLALVFRYACVLLAVLALGSAAYAQNDSVDGVGATDLLIFSILATSGPSGEASAGYVDFTIPIGFGTGMVQHLCVAGNTAVITGFVQDGVNAGKGFVYFVQDNASTSQPDLINIEFVDYIPSACPAFSLAAALPVTYGDLVVTDAVVPPPPPPAVTFESLSALAVQYVLASGAPGCEGISNALASQLASAKKAAERGNEHAKQGALGAFIATVSNLERFLTQEQISELINMAGSL